LQERQLLRPQVPESGGEDRTEQILQTLQKTRRPQRIKKIKILTACLVAGCWVF
jgi:hypothetical protein